MGRMGIRGSKSSVVKVSEGRLGKPRGFGRILPKGVQCFCLQIRSRMEGAICLRNGSTSPFNYSVPCFPKAINLEVQKENAFS